MSKQMNNNLLIDTHPDVAEKFNSYSSKVRNKLKVLRTLILECAEEIEEISHIEETLKWGEPSYLVKIGSTIRIDWKSKSPDQCAMYFKCTSKLVPVFKEVYGDLFNYDKTRAIVFKIDDPIPELELKECIRAALRYHKVKKLPRLDIA